MYWKTLVFSGLLVVVTVLVSYELAVFFTDYTADQLQVIDYVRGRGELSGFTQAEVEHLDDVRAVMMWARWGLIVALIVVVLGRGQGLFYGGVMGILVMLILVLMQLRSFDYLFYWFHLLFFEPGSWVFAADSQIIQLFPLEFFMRMARRIFVSAMGMFLVLCGMGYLRIKNP